MVTSHAQYQVGLGHEDGGESSAFVIGEIDAALGENFDGVTRGRTAPTDGACGVHSGIHAPLLEVMREQAHGHW
jgi:hypothetical protein